ncbi:MAG: DUF1048 domain-containing protein [Eubacteriales bacterium]|jgi:DNA-binding ferritin-like protein (Dps family)
MNRKTKALLQENQRLAQQLGQQNEQVLTDVVVYLRGSALSTWQQEQVHRDILQMLLEGEARGASASEVIGEDYRAFCDSVVEELPKPAPWRRWVSALGGLCLVLAVVAGIQAIFSGIEALAGAKGQWPMLSMTLGEGLSWLLIVLAATAVVQLVCRTSFEQRPPLQNWKLFVLLVAFFIVVTALRVWITGPALVLHWSVWLVLIAVLLGIHWTVEELVD